MHLQKCEYDPYNPLSLDESQGLERYLHFESSMRATEDYDNNKIEDELRYRALVVIFKYSKCENFDPVIPYLALSYFDRFIARGNHIPTLMETIREHDVELLAICCLTLAWKMRDGNFSISKFKEEKPELLRAVKPRIMEMELSILKGLNWDLRQVTALCFAPCFALKFGSTHGFNRRTINEIIIHSQQSRFVKKQKPSVVAASALLAASSYLYPERYPSFCQQMTMEGIIKERHEKKCIDRMIKLCIQWKLTAESFRPRRQVGAGVECEQGAAETSEQSTTEESKQDPAEISIQRAEESKQVAAKAGETSSGHTTAEKSGVASERSEQSDAEDPKQVANQGAADKGKKKAEEAMSEIAKMAEESEDMDFNFPLRWKMGELYEEVLVVFQPLSEIEPVLEASSEEEKEEEEDHLESDQGGHDPYNSEPDEEAIQRVLDGLRPAPQRTMSDVLHDCCFKCCNLL